jgi:hypothetical protein
MPVLYDTLFIPEIDIFTEDNEATIALLFDALYCRVANHRSILNIPTAFIGHLENTYGLNDFVMTVSQACEATLIENGNLQEMTLSLIARRMVDTKVYVIAKSNSPFRALLIRTGFSKIIVVTPEEAIDKIAEIKKIIEKESEIAVV